MFKVIVPPIKSQGIKTKLVPWIRDLIPSREGRWIEPFLGTGVVGFNMGFAQAVMSDTNPHIIRFYSHIQGGKISPALVKKFLEKEAKLLRTADDDGYVHFRLVRDRFNMTFEPLDLLFLSRAGFNGMMRFNKSGKWNIPFCQKPDRFRDAYVTKIVNQVKACSLLIKPNWQFLNRPFEDVIPMGQAGDVIYCDPPYFGRYVDYYNGWTEENEAKLCELLSATPARFILSTWHHNDYRANEMIPKYWSKFNIVTKDHFYHGGGKEENRKSIVEALVFNFESKQVAPKSSPDRPIQPNLFETVAA
ncbi:MAG: DNA adenine methylase [Limisphaerales bacterium]